MLSNPSFHDHSILVNVCYLACRSKLHSRLQPVTEKQGRSQPHSRRWARVPLSSFFPKFRLFFSYFSSNFSHFLPHFGIPGGRASRPPGKTLATPLLKKGLFEGGTFEKLKNAIFKLNLVQIFLPTFY